MWRVIRIDHSRAARRLGRRGVLLLLSGAAWFLIGLSAVGHHAEVHRFDNGHADPPNPLLVFFSNPNWGWAWVIFGSVAFLWGSLRAHSFFRRHDAIGFNAILTPPFLWMVFYIWSFVVALATHGRQGRLESFYGVVVWLLVSLFIIVVAGWAEPTESSVIGRPDATRR